MYVGSSNGRVVLVMQLAMANFEAGLSTILQNAIYHICPIFFTFCRVIEVTVFGEVLEPLTFALLNHNDWRWMRLCCCENVVGRAQSVITFSTM